jgi:hypothetical protein
MRRDGKINDCGKTGTIALPGPRYWSSDWLVWGSADGTGPRFRLLATEGPSGHGTSRATARDIDWRLLICGQQSADHDFQNSPIPASPLDLGDVPGCRYCRYWHLYRGLGCA